MSIRIPVVMFVASLSIACASRNGDTAASGSTAPPPAGQTSGTGQTAGAQAAARITPEQLDAAMKTIAPTNAAMQKALKSSALPDAAKNAQQLATLFGDVERFFAQNKKDDAVKLAQTARTAASAAAGAASAGDATKAMAAAGTVATTCTPCHTAYREGDAKTGYQLKAGTLTP
jgi:cytochrome c556